MYYYYQLDKEGAYADKNGERYAIYSSSNIMCPPGQTPEINGWLLFDSLSAALDARGLSPYTDTLTSHTAEKN